jgi:hypothetical protein
MKKLNPITVGTHTIQIIVSENAAYSHVLFFEATCCGKTRIENRMTHQGPADHPVDLFAKDVAAHARKLAEEVAGRCQSADLVKRFTS